MTWTFDICLKNRKILEGFLNQFTLEELNKVPEGFSNNIIWNIAHVIVTQQLLVYRNSDLPMFVSDNMVDNYKKGTKAEVEVSQAEIEEIKSLLFSSLEKLVEDYNNGLFKNYNEDLKAETKNLRIRVIPRNLPHISKFELGLASWL